jgi:hypothetical protein
LPRARETAADTLSLRQLNRATLARQMLLAREKIAPLRAIERLVAMQAQWPRPPFVGLWSRLQGFERNQLTSLLTERKAVRATFLRGTLHVTTAKDYESLRPALQPMLQAGMLKILKERAAALDLDDLMGKVRKILAKGPRTFEELRDGFLRADPQADERAMGYAVRMTLPLVQVPLGADAAWAFTTQTSFALADEWLGRPLPQDVPARPDELVLRYLAGYGPASVADVQAWSGVQGLRATLETLRPKLRVFRDPEGRELFDLPGAPRPDGDLPAPVRLIPEYDNAVATRADARLVARAHRPRVFLSALRIAATVLVDGFVAGTWRLERKKSTATLTIEPFAPFSPSTRKDVNAEAEALARFAEPDAGAIDVRVTS